MPRAGQTLVAAPVLGRPDAAAAGPARDRRGWTRRRHQTLRAGVPGDGPQDRRSRPKPESAIAIKLANNFVLACAIEAMAEGFALVRKYGVQPQVFYEVITEGLFAAPAYKVYGKLMVDQAYDKPGFTAALGLKDVKLALAAGELAKVPLPSGSVVRDRLIGAIAHGDTDKDWSVLAREQGRACGLD